MNANAIVGLIATLLLPALAIAEPQETTGYFIVSEGQAHSLPLRGTWVKSSIAGVVARVSVTQEYANEGTQPIEAKYVFPVSTRAAVFAMRIIIDDRTVEAKIERTGEAKKIYERAVKEGHAAALLEEHRPNVLELKVGNILPRQTVRVVIDYMEPLTLEHDRSEGGTALPFAHRSRYRFIFPTVVGPRYVAAGESDDSWKSQPRLEAGTGGSPVNIEIKLGMGVPVRDVDSPSHGVAVTSEGDATLVRLQSAKLLDREFVLEFGLRQPSATSGLYLFDDPDSARDDYFLLTIQPPEHVRTEDRLPREYVFIVDVSCSMSGFPLDTAKALMTASLESLTPQDAFNVVQFSGGSAALSEASLPASPGNLERARRFVENMSPQGGTELLDVLKRSLQASRDDQRSTSFVVITDGYVSIEKEAFALVRRSLGEANLFAFGIGTSVNRHLIESLARAGQSEPVIVESPASAATAASLMHSTLRTPVLRNVRLRAEGFDVFDTELRAIPDVFQERPVTVLGRWRGASRGKLSVVADTASGQWVHNIDVFQVVPSDDWVAIRYLWAKRRVAEIEDVLAMEQDAPLEEELTQLGLTHTLLTRTTSFVAVDSARRHNLGVPVLIEQPALLPEGSFGKLGAVGYGIGGGGLGRGTGGFQGATLGLGGIGVRGAGPARKAPAVGKVSKVAVDRVKGLRLSNARSQQPVANYLRAEITKLDVCYESALKRTPTLAGRLDLAWSIDAQGRVSDARLLGSTLRDQATEACVVRALSSFTFPAGAATRVRLPLLFGMSETR